MVSVQREAWSLPGLAVSFALLFAMNGVLTAADPVDLLVGETRVFSLAFSMDGRHLAVGTGGQNPGVKVFDVTAKKELLNLPCERRGAGFSVAFSPDGKRLAIADYDLAVTVRQLSDGTEVASLPGDPDRKQYRQARRLAFHPDGKSLMVGYSTGDIYVWNVADKQVQSKFNHGNEITALAVSSDGKQIATGTSFGVRIWNPADGNPAVKLDQKSSGVHEVQSVVFLPDGKTVVTTDSPGFVRFFSTEDGTEVRSYKMPAVGTTTTVYGVGVSNSGKAVHVLGLVAGLDSKRPKSLSEGIVTIDSTSAMPTALVSTVTARVLAVSPNGKVAAVATGDSGDPVFLYDLTSATRLKP